MCVCVCVRSLLFLLVGSCENNQSNLVGSCENNQSSSVAQAVPAMHWTLIDRKSNPDCIHGLLFWITL